MSHLVKQSIQTYLRKSGTLSLRNTRTKFRQIATTKLLYFNNNNNTHENDNYHRFGYLTIPAIGLITFYLFHDDIKTFFDKNNVFASDQKFDSKVGLFKKNLPTYSFEEVNKHYNLQTRIWVAYKEGVYDVTNFVKQHPGGEEKIMMAAGGHIDPFWFIYEIHKKSEIFQLLESMRIGNLQSKDVYKKSDHSDPYSQEPSRHKILKINNRKPFCAEPPKSTLVENFITPSEVFYVRNHLPVPINELKDYKLEIAVEDKCKKVLTLEDLKNLPQYTITSAIMCGGNRRSEMAQIKPIRGLSWSIGAVGNATWTGAKLSDILELLNVNEKDFNHVQFEGLDLDPSETPYGASIPIDKALDPRKDVIIAYQMNGEDIPIDHGYPVRVIVPGVVGARNVKWLAKINISKSESPSQFQQNDYKSFSPSIDWDNVDFKKAPAIQEMPVTSAICVPQNGEKVQIKKNNTIEVKGYAWSGGGRKIIRVDITRDRGQHWYTADLIAEDTSAKPGRHWAWSLWKIDLPVDKSKGSEIEIWAKAVDSSHNVQPESFENIWNLRGLLGNAYHKIKIQLA